MTRIMPRWQYSPLTTMMALLAALMTSLVVWAAEPRCSFPDFLTTPEGKPWILNHTQSLVKSHVQGGVIRAVDCSKGTQECSSYERVCWQRYPEDKFLVKHLESNFENKFLCMRFLQRSRAVVQLQMSHIKDHHHGDVLCHDWHLALDPWPWISQEHFLTEQVPCPFSGGYNFELRLYDRITGNMERCSEAIPPVRIDSDCTTGEGMTFHFRSPRCLHWEANFDVEQSATCLASWGDNRRRYGLLRKAQDRYFWCMRVDFAVSGEVYAVTVFLDWTCDQGPDVPGYKGRLEFLVLEKRDVTNACTDEFYGCETMDDVCTSRLQPLCARTCGVCNDTESSAPCTFPEDLRGRWLQSQVEVQEAGESQRMLAPMALKEEREELVVDAQSVTLPDQGHFQCETFSGSRQPFKRPLIKRFHNGCYPRFTCLHYDNPAPSILRYRLAAVRTWPIKATDEFLCGSDSFKTPPNYRLPAEERHSRPMLSAVRVEGSLHTVACNLPHHFPNVLAFSNRLGVQGCLVQGTFSHPSSLLVFALRPDAPILRRRRSARGYVMDIDKLRGHGNTLWHGHPYGVTDDDVRNRRSVFGFVEVGDDEGYDQVRGKRFVHNINGKKRRRPRSARYNDDERQQSFRPYNADRRRSLRKDYILSQQSYSCIGSLAFIGSYKTVVTHTEDIQGEFRCWIFVNRSRILLVALSACDTTVANLILSGSEEYSHLLLDSLTVEEDGGRCQRAYEASRIEPSTTRTVLLPFVSPSRSAGTAISRTNWLPALLSFAPVALAGMVGRVGRFRSDVSVLVFFLLFVSSLA